MVSESVVPVPFLSVVKWRGTEKKGVDGRWRGDGEIVSDGF
jgi:hypothetical protein